MNTFQFTHFTAKKLHKLSEKNRERIIQKLVSLKTHPDIQSILVSLKSIKNATHRIRIGKIRLILKQQTTHQFIVVDVGYRKDIYK